MKLLMTLLLLISFNSFSHEGHDEPGAIPPAPHGGIIKEAKHLHHGSHSHDHEKAEEKEIFFEGVYQDNRINVFALELDPKGHKHFLVLNNEDFKNFKVEVIDARKKILLKTSLKQNEKGWSIDISSMRARRFLLNISGVFKGAKYTAKIQVERK